MQHFICTGLVLAVGVPPPSIQQLLNGNPFDIEAVKTALRNHAAMLYNSLSHDDWANAAGVDELLVQIQLRQQENGVVVVVGYLFLYIKKLKKIKNYKYLYILLIKDGLSFIRFTMFFGSR